MLSTESLPELLQTLADSAATAVGADRTLLILMDIDNEEILDRYRGGPASEKIGLDFNYADLQDGLTGWVLRQHESVLSLKNKPDPREGEGAQGNRETEALGSIIVVPLTYQGRILGTLTAINEYDQSDFSQTDLNLLEAMTSQASVSIENRRLFQATESRAQHEQTLREVGARVNAAVDAESILRTAAQEIGRTLGLETFVYLKDPEENGHQHTPDSEPLEEPA